MAVFLGQSGSVELKRAQFDEEVFGTIRSSDVNTDRDRFSFDYPTGMLITGDRVEIKSTDDTNLDFIDASGWADDQVHADGIFYIYVDDVGAIRLYNDFDDAMSGETTGRIELNDIDRDIPIEVEVVNNAFKIFAQVSSFELNTERQVVDVTVLSDEFRNQYSGLISGSGLITCFFDYESRPCDPMIDSDDELPIYMNQLILRTQLGSEFHAKLTLIGRGEKPYGRDKDEDDEVWYEFDARITNIGMSFEPLEPIRSTINFVTTGQIKLLTKSSSGFLLQESSTRSTDRFSLEDNQGADSFIDLEQQD